MYNFPSNQLINRILQDIPDVKNLNQYFVICEHSTCLMTGYETSDFTSHDVSILAHEKTDNFIYFSRKKLGHIQNPEYTVRSVKKTELQNIELFVQADQNQSVLHKIVQEKVSDFEKWKTMQNLEIKLPNKNEVVLKIKI